MLSVRFTVLVALFLTRPSLGADYSLALPGGKLPELIYFDKNLTQRTVARVINYKFQGDIEDAELKKAFKVESLLRLRLEGLRVNSMSADPTRLQMILVGEYAEIRIAETVAAETARSGKPVTVRFKPYEKKFTVGTAVGTGSLTFQFDPLSATFTLVSLATQLRVRGWGVNEQDGATLKNSVARPGPVRAKSISVDW